MREWTGDRQFRLNQNQKQELLTLLEREQYQVSDINRDGSYYDVGTGNFTGRLVNMATIRCNQSHIVIKVCNDDPLVEALIDEFGEPEPIPRTPRYEASMKARVVNRPSKSQGV